MSIRTSLAVGLSLLVVFQSLPVLAAAKTTEELAALLMREGRYREAEVEYERALLENTDAANRPALIERLTDAALRMGDTKAALRILRTWQDRSPAAEQCLWRVGEGKALLALGNAEGVLRLSNGGCDAESKATLDYLRGLACFSERRWECASTSFSSVKGSSLNELSSKALQTVESARQVRPLSPGAAAAWSAVIPGVGYVYARKPQTGAAAFVTNGLFISATYFASRTKTPALAILPGLFSFSWYFGAVRGSAQAAQKANERTIREQMAPITIVP